MKVAIVWALLMFGTGDDAASYSIGNLAKKYDASTFSEIVVAIIHSAQHSRIEIVNA